MNNNGLKILGVLFLIVCGLNLNCQDFDQVRTLDTLAVKSDKTKNIENFSKGLDNKYKENYQVAIEYFEKALKFDPQDDASMYELCDLYNYTGRHLDALDMIKKAIDLQPDNKWYQIKLADFYKQNSDYESFIKIYNKLLADDPNNLDYLEDYIDALLKLEKYEEVLEKLNVLEEEIGVNEYISLQKIEIYKLLGNNKKIIEEMEHLATSFPYETRYLSMLAEIYMQNKRDKDAFNIYLKIKEINPEDPYINISLLDYYRNHGELEKAFQEFLEAIRNKNLDYNTKVQIYEYWFEKKTDNAEIVKEGEAAGRAFIETHPDKEIGYYIIGTVYFNHENYAEAEDMYLKSIERDSSNFISWYQLGFTEIELNNSENLKAYSRKALRFYPEQPMFYLFSGMAEFNLKNYETAIKTLERGRKFSADKKLTTTFDTYIADSYHLLGNKEKAYESYEKIIKADPENIYVLNNYAYYLSVESKELDKALQMSAKTIEAEPKNVTYLDTYAWILYKMGRFAEAKIWMEKVFEYDKAPQGVNYEHYGDILFKLGDTKKAVQNWKKAKKLGDTSKFIDQKIRDEKVYE